MLRARAALWVEYLKLHKLVVHITSRDEVCLRFVALPGVGSVAALAFKTAIDSPTGSGAPAPSAPIWGPRRSAISRGTPSTCLAASPSAATRRCCTVLYEAAKSMLTRYKGWTSLKAWGLRAVAAVARKLAVVLYAIWRDETSYRFSTDAAA